MRREGLGNTAWCPPCILCGTLYSWAVEADFLSEAVIEHCLCNKFTLVHMSCVGLKQNRKQTVVLVVFRYNKNIVRQNGPNGADTVGTL